MSEKVQRFLDLSASFGDEFLRQSGRGILDGVKAASRLVGIFATVALATYFSVQLIEAQKACDLGTPAVQKSIVAPPTLPAPKQIMNGHPTLFLSE